MNTPRFAFAVLLSALAAPAFSQNAPLTPVSTGPAAPGQCVLGATGCGQPRGSAMDPVSENALVGLGQRTAPSLGAPAEKKAAPTAAKIADDPDYSVTDLAALGGQIINPSGAMAPFSQHPAAPSDQADLGAPSDAAGITAAPVPTPSGFSYIHSQKVEATTGEKGTALGTLSDDAKTPSR